MGKYANVQIDLKIKTLCAFILILGWGRCFSQNLLTNGSFEDENICTEYTVNCAPEAWICTSNGFSNYFKDAKLAYSGSHCLAILAGHAKHRYDRSFIRSQLLCGLRKGNTYKIKFFLRSRHNILDSIGVYFTPYDFLFEKNLLYKITPAYYIADCSEKPVKGDTNWQKVEFDYTAKGEENFIAIGNFSKRDITGSTGIEMENNFFVFVDNVSLVPENPNEKICTGWQKTRDDIYDQNERHEYLQRLIKYYRTKPPPPLKLPVTSLQVIDTLILPDVLFETNSSKLEKSSFQLLDSFCKSIAGKKIDSLVVNGHADSTGKFELNEKLSFDRAQSVAAYITTRNAITDFPFYTRGWGSRKPIGNNRTPEGRRKNRRVELLLYIRE